MTQLKTQNAVILLRKTLALLVQERKPELFPSGKRYSFQKRRWGRELFLSERSLSNYRSWERGEPAIYFIAAAGFRNKGQEDRTT